MPGLAGLGSGRDSFCDQERVLRALREVGLVGGICFSYRQFLADRIVILNTLTGLLPLSLEQPAFDPTESTVLFLEGEIYNLAALKRHAVGYSNSSPCALLLALFRERGDEFINLVNGEFNIIIYQKVEDRLIIFCDHLASMPMYYVEQNGRFYFGSEKKFILAMLERSPQLDAVGLLQIFAHRYNLDDRTFLRDIKRMMPASQLIYQDGQLKATKYQVLRFAVPEQSRPSGDLIDEWESQLRQATSVRLQGKERVQVSLSAGLDSRAVSCAISRGFRPISSRTRGTSDSLEAMLAAEIAHRLGFDHFREDPATRPQSVLIPKIAWRIECETHYTNALSLANHAAIKTRCDFIAGGWLGDVSSGGHISANMLLPKSRENFIEALYHRNLTYSISSLHNVFRADFLNQFLPGVREAFFASFEHLEEQTNIQMFEIWDLYQRQRRQTTSSMPVDSYLFEKVRPFYDKEYLNFTLMLPTHLRFGQSLYQSMIYRLGPEIREVPSANNRLRLRPSISGNLYTKGATLLHRAATRGARSFRPAYRNRIERRATEDIGQQIRRDGSFRRSIDHFLESPDCDDSIFNREGIKTMLEEHYRGVSDHSFLLGYVAMFSVGLPYFLTRTTSCPSEAEPLV